MGEQKNYIKNLIKENFLFPAHFAIAIKFCDGIK